MKYKDKVRIKTGFYEGVEGEVTDVSQSKYFVQFDYKGIWEDGDNLELI